MNNFFKVLVLTVVLFVLLLTAACEQHEDPFIATHPDVSTVSTDPTNSTEPEDTVVNIDETVVYDDNDIKVTAKSIVDGFLGPKVELFIENNSSTNIVIVSELDSVNGLMMPYGGLYCEIVAGKTAYGYLTLMNDDFAHSKIDKIASIEFYLKIQDQATYSVLYRSDKITLTTNIEDHVQIVDNEGLKVIYEDSDYKIVYKGFLENEIWEGYIAFYIENKTDKDISIYADNLSINDKMSTYTFWSDIAANRATLDGLRVVEIDPLGIDSIDDVYKIELNFCILDYSNWEKLLTTETIVLTFE